MSKPPQDDLFGQPAEPSEEAKAIARLRHQIRDETENLQQLLPTALPFLVQRRRAWDALKVAIRDPEETKDTRRTFYDSKDLASRAARPWQDKLKAAERYIQHLEKELDALLGPPPGKKRRKKRLSLLPPEIADPSEFT